jgi:hypothetical protein
MLTVGNKDGYLITRKKNWGSWERVILLNRVDNFRIKWVDIDPKNIRNCGVTGLVAGIVK